MRLTIVRIDVIYTGTGSKSLCAYLAWLLDEKSSSGVATDPILFVDVSLILDGAFDCPDGYFLRRWARCAVFKRSWNGGRWLSKMKEVGSLSARSVPTEKWMNVAANKVDRLLGLPRRDSAIDDAVNILAKCFWEGDGHGEF